MSLKNLIHSDDWTRISGVHGNTFKKNDQCVKCPTDPAVVTEIGETGEPFYCKHSVYSFIAWHAPYIYQFELLLNKYNSSSNPEYITLPWLDLTNTNYDYSFLNDKEIKILYENDSIIVENPLAGAYYYTDDNITLTTRNGFLNPSNPKQFLQLKNVQKELFTALCANTFEEFSSAANLSVTYTPLESPHNSLHNIIGGNDGTMSSINIAAFDPIFWLHHCNMDRFYWNWVYKITKKFKEPLYPSYMQESTANSSCAPFFNNKIYSKDFEKYQWGWTNGTGNYAKVSQIIDIHKFPYYYDFISLKHFSPKYATTSFIVDYNSIPYSIIEEKISIPVIQGTFIFFKNVPIPFESLEINAYIFPQDRPINKETDFAGSAFWFGINRKKIHCKRCISGRTNLKIDVGEYVAKHKIDSTNITNYKILVEGDGLLNKQSIYVEKDLVKDGSSRLIFYV